MAQDLPAHASPALAPHPVLHPPQCLSLSNGSDVSVSPPQTLLSPAFTPPSTPGTGTPALDRDAQSIPVDANLPGPRPKLLESLPNVECVVRARIPLTSGQEMFLHLYHNDADNKEHLAIVFGPHIRSRSLDATRPGETEQDRMIRGAYTGRLFPGRMTSGMDGGTGKASPLLRSMHKPTPPPHAPLGQPATAHRSHRVRSTSVTSVSSVDDIPLSSNLTTGTTAPSAPLVRIHSECYTGETVWSARCDCGEQLDEAARLMSLPSAQATGGVIVYLRQEGRGIGLGEKLKAYNLQDLGNDTVEANLLLRHPADARSYGLATAILVDLGLGTDSNDNNTRSQGVAEQEVPDHGGKSIRLLTNNPDKVRAVEGPKREVIVRERVAMVPLAWKSGGLQGVHSEEVESYLSTKVLFICG